MAVKAILFDMGNTLIDFESRPAAQLHVEAVEAVRACLEDRMDSSVPAPAAFGACFSRAWAEVEARHRSRAGQPTLAEAVRRVVEDLGIAASPADIAALEEAHYGVVRAQIRLYPEAREVLAALGERGISLALVSNTIWPTHLHREDLDHLGLRPFFRYVVFSRDFGRMKPHPAIFRAALDELGVAAEEAVVVGDRAEADILGARNAGCRAVLKVHPFTYPEDPAAVPPDAEIRSLREILPLLARF